MQTVNFRCGHCNNLMAVGVEYLGQQVRCPHCQQVVIAPSNHPQPPENTPPPEPFSQPSTEEALFKAVTAGEDIFSHQHEAHDVLFGSEHQGDEIPAQTPEPPESPVPTPSNGSTSSSAPLQHGQDNGLTHNVSMPWMANETTPPESSAAETSGTTVGETPTTRRVRESSKNVGWFVPLVFIPMVLYAVLATVAAGYLYILLQTKAKSLFEEMPDYEGDSVGVRKNVSRKVPVITRSLALQPLPPKMQIKLGETLTIGDLEVTPTRVEKKRIQIVTEGAEGRPEPGKYESLVLHLKLKNLSDSYAFTPIDNYFDRHWSPKSGTTNYPLTVLVAGEEAFFGGSTNWASLQNPTRRVKRDWLVGRKNVDSRGLLPGESMQTFTATDGWNKKVPEYLFGLDETGEKKGKPYTGPLMWRVQLRRGLIQHNGKRYPATCVIGVKFTQRDYMS